MKKIIVITVALAFGLLSVGFVAKARPVVRLAHLAYDTWEEAVADLQQQIDNIARVPGPTGPQGPMGPTGGLHLYDANNQDLGIFLALNDDGGGNGAYRVFSPQIGKRIDFGIQENTQPFFAYVSAATSLFFVTPDCTGNPYLGGESVRPIEYAYRIFSNDTNTSQSTFYQAIPVVQHSVAVQRIRHPGGTCDVGNVPSFSPFAQAFELEEVNLPFTLPLAYPLRIQ